ncbi:MAG: ABC transporter permease [Rubrivivax sp. SCN 71-131]|mgnify:CR=1 FL=1|jgi:branched-chain amino acid transport system permease protein|nr:MAG: ABC transporter permease [Rubrivivax sp. SCN 71-131]
MSTAASSSSQGTTEAAPATRKRERATARAHRIAFAIMLAALIGAPLLGVYPVFMMKVMCFALFACAFNLLLGYGGLLSFGHAMFIGSAGYAAAHSAKVWGFTPELAVLFAALCAGALGWLTGLLAIRRQGIYFAMITLALAQMVFFFSLQAPFTGGEDGIQAVPRGRLFGLVDLSQPMAMYAFVLVIFVAGFALIYRIVHSPFGQVLQAIRENEPRAISLGYDADRFKHRAFVLSAALAGVAGGTKAILFQLASLTDVHWSMSGEVVLMTLLGGMGTIFGPVVGAAVIVTMQNYLAELGAWVTVVQGAIFVVCVLAFRRGIIGELGHWLKKPL